jgi:hypothetical protein
MRKLAESPYRRRGQRIWTRLHRVRQAMMCRRHKPWLKSTGPRSFAGKARSCANAFKHGMRSAPLRELARLLAAQKRFLLSYRKILLEAGPGKFCTV